MIGHSCDHWAGAIALQAAGRLPAEEAAALAEHLRDCPECRREAESLSAVGRSLQAYAAGAPHRDPEASRHEVEVPESLARAVSATLQGDKRRARHLKFGGAIAAAAAAVTGIAVAVSALLTQAPTPQPVAAARTVVLAGQPGVHASAKLTAEGWGSAVYLQEKGQPAGQVFNVTMRTKAGTWWSAGSYRTTSGATEVELSCGVPPDRISSMEVRMPSGPVVLTGVVR